ncbi:uncharacterized protein LOC142161053 isoform X1 [Mixophyes fleayi]|uniref:uncharacterized protein LOC142161053 isoform X1 n=2 Tax=Mixophyes fleayi TaxID=3061075 RepID=UPI003F4E2C69
MASAREVPGQDFPFETLMRCANQSKNVYTTDIATENDNQSVELPAALIHESKTLLQQNTEDHETVMVAEGPAETSLCHVTTETDIDTTAELLPSGGTQSHQHALRTAVSETLPPQPRNIGCPTKIDVSFIENQDNFSPNKHPQGKHIANTTQPFWLGISSDILNIKSFSETTQNGTKLVMSEDVMEKGLEMICPADNFIAMESILGEMETSTSQNLKLTLMESKKTEHSKDLTVIKLIDMKEPNQLCRMESTAKSTESCNEMPKDRLVMGEPEPLVNGTTDLYSDLKDPSLTLDANVEQFDGYSQCIPDHFQKVEHREIPTNELDDGCFTDSSLPEDKNVLLFKLTERQLSLTDTNIYNVQYLDGQDKEMQSITEQPNDTSYVNDKKEKELNIEQNDIGCSKETYAKVITMAELISFTNGLFNQNPSTSPECEANENGDITHPNSLKTLTQDDSNVDRSKLANQFSAETCSPQEVLPSSFKEETEENAHVCSNNTLIGSIGHFGGKQKDIKMTDGETRKMFSLRSMNPDTCHTKLQKELPEKKVTSVCEFGFQNEPNGNRDLSADRHVTHTVLVKPGLSSSPSQLCMVTSPGSDSVFTESSNERGDLTLSMKTLKLEHIDADATNLVNELHKEEKPPDGHVESWFRVTDPHVQVSINSLNIDNIQHMDHENGIKSTEEEINKSSSHNIMAETWNIKMSKEFPENDVAYGIVLQPESSKGKKDTVTSSEEIGNGNQLIISAQFLSITTDPTLLCTTTVPDPTYMCILPSPNPTHQCISSYSDPSYLCTNTSLDTCFQSTTASPDPSYQCTTTSPDPSYHTTTKSPDSSYQCTATSPEPPYQCTSASPDSSYQTTTKSPDSSYQYTTTSPDPSYHCTTTSTDLSYQTAANSPYPSYHTTTNSPDPSYQYTTTSPDPSYQTTTNSPDPSKQCTTTSPDPSYHWTTTSPDISYQTAANSPDPSKLCTATSPDPSYHCTTTSPDPSYHCTTTSPDPSYHTTTNSPDPSYQCTTASPDSSYQCTTTSPDPTYQFIATSPDPSYQSTTNSPDSSYQCTTTSLDSFYHCTATSPDLSYQTAANSPDPSKPCTTTSPDPSYHCTTTSSDSSYKCTATSPDSSYKCTAISPDPSYQCRTASPDPSKPCTTTSPDPFYHCTTTSPDPSYQTRTNSPDPSKPCTTTSPDPSYQCTTTSSDSSYKCTTTSSDTSYKCTAISPDPSYQCRTASPDPSYQCTTTSPDPSYQYTTTSPDPSYQTTTNSPDSSYQCTTTSLDSFYHCTATSPDLSYQTAANSPDPSKQCTTTSPDPSYHWTTTSPDISYQTAANSPDPSKLCTATSPDPSYHCTTTSPDPSYHCTTTSPDPSYHTTTNSPDPSYQCTTASPDSSYQCTTTSPDPTYQFIATSPDPSYQSTTNSPDSSYQCTTTSLDSFYHCTATSPDLSYQTAANSPDPSKPCTTTSPDPSYHCTTTSSDSSYKCTATSPDSSYKCTAISPDPSYQCRAASPDPSKPCTTTSPDPFYHCTTTSPDPSYQTRTNSPDPSKPCTTTSPDPSYQCTTTSSDSSYKCTTTSSDSSYKCTAISPDPSYQCRTASPDPSYQTTTRSLDPSKQCTTTSPDSSYQCTATSPDPSYKCTATSPDPSYQCTTTSSDQSYQTTTRSLDPSYQCTTTSPDPSYQCTTNSPDPSYQYTTNSPDPSYQYTTNSPDPSYQCTTTSPDLPSQCKIKSPDLNYQCTTTSPNQSNQYTAISSDPSYQRTTTSPDLSYQCTTASPDAQLICIANENNWIGHLALQTSIKAPTQDVYGNIIKQNDHYFLEKLRKKYLEQQGKDLILLDSGIVLAKTVNQVEKNITLVTLGDGSELGMVIPSSKLFLYYQPEKHFYITEQLNEDWYYAQDRITKVNMLMKKVPVTSNWVKSLYNFLCLPSHPRLLLPYAVITDRNGYILFLMEDRLVLGVGTPPLGYVWNTMARLLELLHFLRYCRTHKLLPRNIRDSILYTGQEICFDPSSLYTNDDLYEFKKCLKDSLLFFLCNGRQEFDMHSEVFFERVLQLLEQDCPAQINPTSLSSLSQLGPVPFCLPSYPNGN